MKEINWYPGHMTKSIRMITEEIKTVDCCLYVLDSRAPKSCINPDFESLLGAKPVIYILNKSDLVPADKIEKWRTALSSETRTAVILDCTKTGSSKIISPIILNLCKEKIEKYRSKGVKMSVKAMVIGVPNCGKSTFINNLAKGARTVTGNKAGVTRGKQWVRINDYLEVMDTPGTLYPKLSDQVTAKHLAYIGSIKDEILETVELALELVTELKVIEPRALTQRYGITLSEESSVLDEIAKSKGFLLKGGETDVLRAASMLIDDFRKGRLGKIILEECL